MSQQLRTQTPLIQIRSAQVIAVKISVAAKDDVPVLNEVPIAASERPDQPTLVRSTETRVAKDQAVA